MKTNLKKNLVNTCMAKIIIKIKKNQVKTDMKIYLYSSNCFFRQKKKKPCLDLKMILSHYETLENMGLLFYHKEVSLGLYHT